MQVKFPYGQSFLKVELPQSTRIVSSNSFPISEDPQVIIKNAIENPIGTKPINQIIPDNSSVVIIVSDHTRYVPNEMILNVLEPYLSNSNTSILIGGGLHEPPKEKEIQEILGRFSQGPFPIHCHDAKKSATTDLGKLKSGTPLYLNSIAVNSDVRITISRSAPHFFAGFSGGPKAVFPGIAGERSILANHNFVNISNHQSRVGNIEDNPIYQEMLEAAMRFGVDLSINTIIDRNHLLCNVFAGNIKIASQQAAKYLETFSGISKFSPAKVVISSNSGYPLDRCLYQVVKGIYTASKFCEKNGVIIIVAECVDGVGHDVFEKIAQHGSPTEILEFLQTQSPPLQDQWQVQILADILLHHRVIVVTNNIPEHLLHKMNLDHAPTIASALQLLKEQETNIIAIPEGPEVFPT